MITIDVILYEIMSFQWFDAIFIEQQKISKHLQNLIIRYYFASKQTRKKIVKIRRFYQNTHNNFDEMNEKFENESNCEFSSKNWHDSNHSKIVDFELNRTFKSRRILNNDRTFLNDDELDLLSNIDFIRKRRWILILMIKINLL